MVVWNLLYHMYISIFDMWGLTFIYAEWYKYLCTDKTKSHRIDKIDVCQSVLNCFSVVNPERMIKSIEHDAQFKLEKTSFEGY